MCCGAGNNGGDGYLVAKYLYQQGFEVDIYATELGQSVSLKSAHQEAKNQNLNIFPHFNFKQNYDVIIDALFGIGLDRDLTESWLDIIDVMNAQHALKIAIDIPSGLQNL